MHHNAEYTHNEKKLPECTPILHYASIIFHRLESFDIPSSRVVRVSEVMSFG